MLSRLVDLKIEWTLLKPVCHRHQSNAFRIALSDPWNNLFHPRADILNHRTQYFMGKVSWAKGEEKPSLYACHAVDDLLVNLRD